MRGHDGIRRGQREAGALAPGDGLRIEQGIAERSVVDPHHCVATTPRPKVGGVPFSIAWSRAGFCEGNVIRRCREAGAFFRANIVQSSRK